MRSRESHGHGRGSRLEALARLCAAVALLFLSACGPALYVVNFIPATRAVEQARESGASDHAPYEYHYANEHLRKAREEAAEAAYEDAVRYADVAEEYGTKARDLARRRMREMGR
jgi:hypothetical protein